MSIFSRDSTNEGYYYKSIFTPTQWQELEHQALIYKYMVSGVPIPVELIYPIKMGLDLSMNSRGSPYHSSFQMGYGKKVDLEPGRCKRTDGKKWRCAKETYSNSKYCEKHMNRGKNRSRKPVEPSPSTSTINKNISSMPNNNNKKTPLSSSSSSTTSIPNDDHDNVYKTTNFYPAYITSSSSRLPTTSDLSLHNGSSVSHHKFLDFGSSPYNQPSKDIRHFDGSRNDMKRAYIPEIEETKSDSYDEYSSHYDSQYHHSFSDYFKQPQQNEVGPSCVVLGTDINSSKYDKKGQTESEKQFHYFFGSEWTPNNTDPY